MRVFSSRRCTLTIRNVILSEAERSEAESKDLRLLFGEGGRDGQKTETKQRPMRTLTVKNFSVINEAKLEFGKITVLIGPQSSGKSLLCKLAFFFEQVVPELVWRAVNAQVRYDELCRTIQADFVEKFPKDSWNGQAFRVVYKGAEYENHNPGHDRQLPTAVQF